MSRELRQEDLELVGALEDVADQTGAFRRGHVSRCVVDKETFAGLRFQALTHDPEHPRIGLCDTQLRTVEDGVERRAQTESSEVRRPSRDVALVSSATRQRLFASRTRSITRSSTDPHDADHAATTESPSNAY